MQLFTVCEFGRTYDVISELNHPLPIEWHPVPSSPMSSLEQLPVAVVLVSVSVFVCVDETQDEPLQYWPDGQEVCVCVCVCVCPQPLSQLDGAPSESPAVSMGVFVSTRLQLT